MSEISPSPLRVAAPADGRSRIDAVTTPTSPVTRRDLFAGRAHALHALLALTTRPGVHAVIHGEAGTGKTSLAGIVPEFAETPLGVVRVEADAMDTFASLWSRVADTARTTVRRAERGLASSPFPADTPALAAAGPVLDEHVLAFLSRLSAGAPAWVIVDGLDQVADPTVRTRMRVIAEATAAVAPGVTLVLVGRGASSEPWLEPSAAFETFALSRMSPDEAVECAMRLLRHADLEAEDAMLERAIVLANGLPGAMHGLVRSAAHAALATGAHSIDASHLKAAMATEVAGAPEEVRQAYEQSIVRARRGIYPEILLACALAPRDAHGTFSVADVCEAVTRIVRREVRGLTNQVSALTEAGRGAVLEKQGAAKTARYRFLDPRLEPYILMRGLEEGWATHPSLDAMPTAADDDMARAA